MKNYIWIIKWGLFQSIISLYGCYSTYIYWGMVVKSLALCWIILYVALLQWTNNKPKTYIWFTPTLYIITFSSEWLYYTVLHLLFYFSFISCAIIPISIISWYIKFLKKMYHDQMNAFGINFMTFLLRPLVKNSNSTCWNFTYMYSELCVRDNI